LLLDERRTGMIADGMLEVSGTHDVGEDQRDQPGAVSAAEFLDLCPIRR
jgi:hypothetical protein